MGCHPSHWRTNIFQDGFCTTNQHWSHVYGWVGGTPMDWKSRWGDFTSKLVMCSTKRMWKTVKNKLRWYPQQPQRFIFTNLSEACCEAKRWKRLSWVSVNLMAANPVEPDLALHQSLPEPSPEPSEPFPEPRWTWSGASSAHRSYSGLKTPLAYAAGEKCQQTLAMLPWNMWSLLAT